MKSSETLWQQQAIKSKGFQWVKRRGAQSESADSDFKHTVKSQQLSASVTIQNKVSHRGQTLMFVR